MVCRRSGASAGALINTGELVNLVGLGDLGGRWHDDEMTGLDRLAVPYTCGQHFRQRDERARLGLLLGGRARGVGLESLCELCERIGVYHCRESQVEGERTSGRRQRRSM